MRLRAALVLTLLLVPLGSVQPAAGQSADRPNILLIIADDMGLDASRCYDVGQDQAPMPVIENLCAGGLVFEAAYAAPLCSPTRATILTGRYGFRTGVGSVISQRGGHGLSDETPSLFDVLSNAGYASALIGKWHLAGGDDPLDHPARLGVPSYFGPFKGALRDYFHWDAVDNGTEISVEGYATSVLTDRAIGWVSGQRQPWFLWLAYTAPHAPFHLPPAELHSAGGLSADADDIRRDPLPYYNAMLEAMDTEIGRLLESLPAAVRANTVVMFIGDNGTPNQVARQLYGDRGAKGSIFEGGTHVPLIIAGPGVSAGRSDALVNSVDLFATIAGLAGAGPQAVDGADLGPVLAGGAGVRRHAYVEHFSDTAPRGSDVFGRAIRDHRYELVVPEGAEPMLFDLAADPFEQTDLLAESPSQAALSTAAALEAALEEIRN